MKNIIIFIFTMTVALFVNAQVINKTTTDSVTQKEILIGKCNLKGLFNNTEFKVAYDTEYKYYNVDSATLKLFQDKLDNLSIILFMGTWCGDSKEQVPRFFKIMDKLNYDIHSIKINCNKRGVYSDDPYSNQFNILKIPTFIIYKDGNEIGRIVETPKVSLEKDLLEIISKSF